LRVCGFAGFGLRGVAGFGVPVSGERWAQSFPNPRPDTPRNLKPDTSTPPQYLEGMDSEHLDSHRASLSACRKCAFADSSIRPIVSRAVDPRAMLVGQAPGKVEAAGGQPFAGRAGKQLFRWFERAGIAEDRFRDRVYIAAITRCFPGSNVSGRGDRVPSVEERQACSPWLDAELTLIRPNVLILVGRLAITRFLPAVPLEELIGRAHAVEHAGGRSLAIPLPHPSGASSWIHQGNHRRLLADAIALVEEHASPLIGDRGSGIGDRATA
jgi:uracil-DNA glycosylase